MNNEEKNISEEKNIKNNKQKKEELMLDNNNDKNQKEKRIIELENMVIQIQKRDYENILRSKAEIENIRRRSEIYIEKVHKFALERFINELLPVIDNLERALNISDIKDKNILECTLKGIELTLKSFLNAVRKFGVDIIESIDVPFDPDIHQAMTTLKSDDYKPNHIVKIMQKGYSLNGRLIRPAMVIVSKKKN